MKILGVDCGWLAPGFAVVESDSRSVVHAECFQTTGLTAKQRSKLDVYKSEDDARRMIEISTRIKKIANDFQPDLAVLELPTGGGKSSNAVKAMALGTCVAVVTLNHLEIPVIYITPRANKLAATNNPGAEKDEMVSAIQREFPSYTSWPHMVSKRNNHRLDDIQCWAIADALSCVLTHIKGL